MNKLYQLKQAGNCCITHIETSTDSNEYTFAILSCHGCEQRIFCLRLVKAFEKELNLMQGVKV